MDATMSALKAICHVEDLNARESIVLPNIAYTNIGIIKPKVAKRAPCHIQER